MNFLDDMENLVRLDPDGWEMAFYNNGNPRQLSYDNRIFVTFAYNGYGHLVSLTCFPGAVRLGWLERRRFRKIQRLLFSQQNRKVAEGVAERVLRQRQQDAELALAEFDVSLHNEFADLEAQEAARLRRVKEAPVVSGFLKGLTRKALVEKDK
jgi:hypothetical protein